jgi:prophage DNA circulation protein
MKDPWVLGYVQASFRGARFWVQRITTPVGRRIIPHTYPRSDEIDLEDQGRAHPVIPVDAYVVGADYYTPRDKFERALSQPGPGELIHPYYRGVLMATAAAGEGVEDADAGGMIRYSLTFYVQSSSSPVRIVPNVDARVAVAKENGNAANKAAFVSAYSITDKIFGALADAQGAIDSGFDQIKKAKNVAAIGSDFQRAIQNAQGRLIALSLNADYVADTFTDLINWGADPASYHPFGTVAEDTAQMLIEQRRLFDYFSSPSSEISDDLPPSYTANKINNFCAVTTLFTRGGLCRGAEFSTSDDVVDFKRGLYRDIDRAVRDMEIEDSVIAALQDFKVAVFDFLQTKLLTLPSLVAYTPSAPMSALTLSYMVYGDFDHEAMIIARNKLVHPGFVPAGVDLWIEAGND